MDALDNHDIVKSGSKIRVDFTLSDEDGAVVQADKSTFDVIVGFGQLLPLIEEALTGARRGETRKVRLKAHEAFGERDPEKIIEFDREEFPEDVARGDHFEAEQEDGTILVLSVIEVLEDAIVVDLNHPLAGQNVSLNLTVVEVRPADQIELDQAKSEQNRSKQRVLDVLLPPETLLRGRSER